MNQRDLKNSFFFGIFLFLDPKLQKWTKYVAKSSNFISGCGKRACRVSFFLQICNGSWTRRGECWHNVLREIAFSPVSYFSFLGKCHSRYHIQGQNPSDESQCAGRTPSRGISNLARCRFLQSQKRDGVFLYCGLSSCRGNPRRDGGQEHLPWRGYGPVRIQASLLKEKEEIVANQDFTKIEDSIRWISSGHFSDRSWWRVLAE